MRAIFRREAKSYYQTLTGWLFIAVLMAVFGFYFYVYNLRYGYPYITSSITATNYILLIMVPILTMRSFAEERRNKTDQLILTSPVSVEQLTLGKYLAMLSVFTADIAVMAAAILIPGFFGTVPYSDNYLTLLGYWLYGASMIAVGMFLSSLTENIVIAAVATFGLLFLSNMMSSICNLISTGGNTLTKILEIFDLNLPLKEFQSGCLSIPSVVYYLSVILLFGFLTVQSVQKRRWSINRKKLAPGVYSLSAIAIVCAILVALNLIAGALPEEVASIDCSYGKVYELTDTTKEFLADLDQNVTIYILASEKSADAQISETVRRYESLSDHIEVEYIDTASNPSFYKQYTDSNPTAGSLIVAGEARAKVIDYYDIYVYSYTLNTSTYSYDSDLTGYDAEGQLSSAIEYVTMDSDQLPVIYAITGHDETEIGSDFQSVLQKANVTYEDLELLKIDAIPDNTAAIIINAPHKDFNAEDAQKVRDYLAAGGKAIISVDYGYTDLENFNSILKQWKVQADSGLVVENDSQYYYNGNSCYLLPTVNWSAYTSSVYGAYVFAPYSVALDIITGTSNSAEETVSAEKETAVESAGDTDDVVDEGAGDTEENAIEGAGDTEENAIEDAGDTEAEGASTGQSLNYTTMLETTTAAVAKENADQATTSELEDGDREGLFAVALAVEDSDTGMKMVVYGTSYLLADEADQIVSSNNSAMFNDCISELAGDVSLKFSVIAAKDISLGNLTIPTMTGLIAGGLIMGVVPLFLLFAGLAIWMIRRKE